MQWNEMKCNAMKYNEMKWWQKWFDKSREELMEIDNSWQEKMWQEQTRKGKHDGKKERQNQ
jgi:hypothetical protein